MKKPRILNSGPPQEPEEPPKPEKPTEKPKKPKKIKKEKETNYKERIENLLGIIEHCKKTIEYLEKTKGR